MRLPRTRNDTKAENQIPGYLIVARYSERVVRSPQCPRVYAPKISPVLGIAQ